MKKLIAILAALVLVMPMTLAVSVGSGIGIDIVTEDFAPLVWLCDNRLVMDDATEPGRITMDGEEMFERINNYAFEGEQIQWTVLVMDKNGINKVEDVYGTVGTVQGEGNDIEVNCVEDLGKTGIDDSCNARILEEQLQGWDAAVMRYYTCTLTVETPASMWGEYWITVEAMDLDGLMGTMDENEYWFLNPEIALAIEGAPLTFEDVRPGTMTYSNTLTVTNDADDGSGVALDMFISGTDFYDSSSSGAMCPTTNQLVLGDGDSDCDAADPFCYYAVNGAYSTAADLRSDAEGYVGINYATGFNNPNPFYGAANGDNTGYEIMQSNTMFGATYFAPNVLMPGADMSITFRLNLPEPCNGDFDSGRIDFWGEAI